MATHEAKLQQNQPSVCTIKKYHKFDANYIKLAVLGGGGGGNRTPVRKRFLRNFSGRRVSFAFPHPSVGTHTHGLGSFIVHGALKALRTHVRR